MQSEEQRLIDGLFDRLKQTETHNARRDAAAEQRIAQHLSEQPAAPYYMAQTILIQEAAMKQLTSRIQALEEQVANLEHNTRPPQSSGGFLAGLFGGGSASRISESIPGSQQYASSAAAGSTNTPQAAAPTFTPPRAGSGFMAGALQTAAGVAGGVMLGNMLTSMFHHSQPEEIVNIINEPSPGNGATNTAGDDNQTDDSPFLNQDADLPQNNSDDYADFDNDDFNDDDFGNDDDSFI